MGRRCNLIGGGKLALFREVNGIDTSTGDVVKVRIPSDTANLAPYSPSHLDDIGANKECFLRGRRGQRIAEFSGCVGCRFNVGIESGHVDGSN